jgi:hypothetical protein
MNLKQTLLIAVMGAGLAMSGAASASANTWQDNHPRRVEVNHRLDHQDYRINRDLADGRITAGQAAYLHAEDRSIRGEERFDASFHGSHLTPGEQARINHQENRVSGQIYRDAY